MSSIQGTPPFQEPSEEGDAIGQDSSAWTNEKQDNLKEMLASPTHGQPHLDVLPPIREKLTDAEWEEPAVMVR